MPVYSRNRSALLRSSASAQCNNLTVLNRDEGKSYLAVVHKSSVSVITLNDEGQQQSRQITCKGPPGYKKIVLQAKWCRGKDITVLVIAFHQGIQIMDADGSVLLFWYHFEESDAGTFGRGIASISNNVYVGSYNGQILIFNLGAKGNAVTQLASISSRKSPITDLASDDRNLLSACEDGTLTLWTKQTSGQLQSKTFDGDGFPATSVAIWKEFFAAGYGSGYICIFSLITMNKVAEILAHARWITAIDFVENSGFLLSVSEDSFVRLWQIGDNEEASLMRSICIPDVQLCGARFLDHKGLTFALTGYELEEVLIFTAD